MKVTKHSGSDMRQVLVAMITNAPVCARIASQWTPEGLFETPWANLVGGWCVRHMRRYSTVPDKDIYTIYEQWADGRDDDEAASAIDGFLRTLADEAASAKSESNEYVLDLAARCFNRARLLQTYEAVLADLERGAVDDAQQRAAAVKKVELGVGAMVKPAEDYSVWQSAFEQEGAVAEVVAYPAPADAFFRHAFTRGSFYAFMGPDKSWKSFFLLDFAFRALRQRRRVLFVDTGDNSQDDVMQRLGCRLARRPLVDEVLRIPRAFNGDDVVYVDDDRVTEAVTAVDSYRAMQRLSGGRDTFRVCCYPNSTLTVAALDGLLGDYDREGWRPDVVVLDYADIMAPPPGAKDPLEQIDELWKQLRRLSQQRHVVLVTATQSNAAAYKQGGGLLSREHFSGRKTKLAHVNGMIGINITNEERNKGVARLNWVVRRKGRYDSTRPLRVAGCLAIANPIIISDF